MTTLTINLSATLQGTLNQAGMWAWAVYFDGTTVNFFQLAGQVGGSQQVLAQKIIDLPGDLNGGKIYLIEQSAGGSTAVPLTFGAGNIITKESDLNWNNASTYDFRYDSFEVSLLGLAGDAGNLTDVNGFGIPMSVEVAYPNGATTQTRGYKVTGSDIFGDIAGINGGALVHKYTDGPLAPNTDRMAASPATALAAGGPGGASATDWNAYVESFGANGANGIHVAGYFNGAPSVEYINYNGVTYAYDEYHNAGFYSYKVSFTPGAGTAGTYTFTPDGNSQIRGTISISTDDLANSIYSTLGSATVASPNGAKYRFSTLNGGTTTDMNTGDNNQWGAFFVKLLTGFIGGYYGGTATQLNPLISGTVDLSDNWNFDPSFAFGGKAGAGQPGHVTPWSWDSSYGAGVSYDPYALVFFSNSNSYGNGYSDAVTSLFQQGGPLIPVGYSNTLAGPNPISTVQTSSTVTVADPNAANYAVGDLVTFPTAPVVGGLTLNGTYAITSIGAGSYQFSVGTAQANATTSGGGSNLLYQKNVPDIELTLFDDSETPTGYTPTEIFNTSDGPFVSPLASTGPPNLSLIISLGLGQMRPDPGSTVTVGFYDPTSLQFTTATITPTTSNPLYETWLYDVGSNQFSAVQGASPTGSILQLNGLPYNDGINWYQITITTPEGVSRAYNLYAKADSQHGVLNPYYQGVDQSGALAIDNLAVIPPATLVSTQQYYTSLNISAFNGGTLSMDPGMLTLITDSSIISAGSNSATWPTAMAPALGTIDSLTGAFSNWGGSTNLNTPNSGLNNVTTGELAFGWTGSDNNWIAYNASQQLRNFILAGYTNKVSGLNFAQITFLQDPSQLPVTATADIDGKWLTAAAQFGNGTYYAVMTEYRWTDHGLQTPIANASQQLVFTVDISGLPFKNVGASYIELDGSGGAADGNWIRLETASSSMPNGTLLAYATDSSGNLIGRDGKIGPGVTLDDAVLAHIGAVATDGGTVLFSGAQSVYLKVGQQLHFAVQTGNDDIQRMPDVLVAGNGQALSVRVNGTFGELTLLAAVDNTLSEAAKLAGGQRQSDNPWVYLADGQQIHVEIAGSAANVNTVHFVHIAVNPATGAWSVGGVGYGNTDAFREAVQANWDAGLQVTGGHGNFQATVDWTASSGSGFYAPVLLTQNGDIFVIGTANVDGRDHVRMYGENVFGIEDLRADQGSDFDFNDMVMKLTIL